MRIKPTGRELFVWLFIGLSSLVTGRLTAPDHVGEANKMVSADSCRRGDTLTKGNSRYILIAPTDDGRWSAEPQHNFGWFGGWSSGYVGPHGREVFIHILLRDGWKYEAAEPKLAE